MRAVLAGAVLGVSCTSGGDDRAATPACGDTSGRSELIELTGLSAALDRDAVVHLPPCYDEGEGRYPTVYLLHGGGMAPSDFVESPINAADVADRLAVDGVIEPVILVMPPRATTFVGFPERVLDDLMAEVEGRYRSVEEVSARAIGGFSAGGPALGLSVFTGPDRFGTVGFFAASFTDGAVERVLEGADDFDRQPSVFIEYGDRDRLQSRVVAIEEMLVAFGVTPDVSIVPGDHSLEFVGERIDEWLIEFDARMS